MNLLEVKNLKVHFPVKAGMFSRVHETVKAVDDVSFSIAAGETLGLVGESGCGKTTLGRAIVRLVEPTAGEISLDGEDILKMSGAELRARRLDRDLAALDRKYATRGGNRCPPYGSRSNNVLPVSVDRLPVPSLRPLRGLTLRGKS